MTPSSTLALFSAMVLLAALPSVSVLAVVTRSATFGFRHGACTALGIVAGDVIFIVITLWGLALLAATLGSFFALIKYAAAAYLIFLGVGLYRSKPGHLAIEEPETSSLMASFLTGLGITLGDQKATLFYLGFLPAFVDLAALSVLDIAVLITTTVVAVGGVKLVYALLANRARLSLRSQTRQVMNRVAGGVMVAVGLALAIKS